MSPVINEESYTRITKYLSEVGTKKNPSTKVLVGGKCMRAMQCESQGNDTDVWSYRLR